MSAVVRAVVILVLLAAAAVPFADSGRAQGFFQSLFGFGNAGPAPAHPGLPPSYRAPIVPPVRGAPADHREHDQAVSLSGSYRTMCVRMCDGYYFPISASVSRRAFHRDAGICRASCGHEAQLFFHPSSSGDASTMVDLTGRAYAKLSNAFRYRKTLVDGCKCKPDPWARSEVNRHLAYAAQAAAASRSVASAPASPEAGSTTKVAETTTEQPEPPEAHRASEVATESAVPPRAPRATRDKPTATQPRLADRSERRAPITSIKAPDQPTRVAGSRSQRPLKTSPYGLGGGGLRWPGD